MAEAAAPAAISHNGLLDMIDGGVFPLDTRSTTTDPSAQVLTTLFGTVISPFINNIQKMAIVKLPNSFSPVFAINTKAELDECIKEIIGISKLTLVELERFGPIDIKIYISTIKKIRETIETHLFGTVVLPPNVIMPTDPSKPGKRVYFSVDDTKEKLDRWMADVAVGIMNQLYTTHMRMTKTEDLIGADGFISCSHFALKRIGAKKTGEGTEIDRIETFVQKRLKAQQIDAPTANDLVVYRNDSGIPQHVGVYQADGRVLSKLGINNEFVHLHPINQVPVNYGTKVVFYRLPEASLSPK